MKILFITLAWCLASPAWAGPSVEKTFSLSQSPFGLSAPSAAAADPVRHEVWVAGSYSNNVVIIDAASKMAVAEIAGITNPSAMAFDKTRGLMFVAAQSSLHVIDAASRGIKATFPLNSYYPRAAAADEAAGEVILLGRQYAFAYGSNQDIIRRLNSANGAVKASAALPADHHANGFALSPSRLFVALYISAGSAANQSELWVLDKASMTVLQKLSLGTIGGLSEVAYNPADGSVYVGSYSQLTKYKPDASGLWAKVSAIPASGYFWKMALDAASGRLYGLDTYNNKVSIVDLNSGKFIKALPTGTRPTAIALDAQAGLVFAANQQSNDLSLFDLKTDTALGKVDLARLLPRAMALVPGTDSIMVGCSLTSALTVWNKRTFALEKILPEPYETPTELALFPALKKTFVLSGSESNGYLRKLMHDAYAPQSVPFNAYSLTGIKAYLEGNQLLATQLYAPSTGAYQGALLSFDASAEVPLKTALLGSPNDYPKTVAVNNATGKAYVALYGSNQVAVIDIATAKVLKKIPVGFYPVSAAVNPNLNRIYVANYGSNSVSVIDGTDDAVIASVAVGDKPKAVAVKRRGARVYVANSGGKTVTVLDGRTLAVAATLPSGGAPESLVVDEAEDRVYAANTAAASITVLLDPAASDTQPPTVVHAPLTGIFPEDQDIAVDAQITDDASAPTATLTYWEPGSAAYHTTPMSLISGSAFRGNIPARFLTSLKGGKVSYFIDASDAEGNGPPLGQGMGSPTHPNEFTVRKTLSPLWSQKFGRISGGFYRMVPGPTAAIGDIRPDLPGLEVATGNEEYWPNQYEAPGVSGRWFLFGSRGSLIFWKDTENDEAHSSVNLFDLNGDGVPEMLGGTTSGREMQAWDGQGRWLWRHLLNGHHLSTPAVDILKPGTDPMAYGGSFDNYFRCVNGRTGALVWSFKAETWIWSSPAVADLDGDGRKEVVFGSDQLTIGRPNFYALDAESGAVRWTAALGGHMRASAALWDTNGDGILEVLIGAPDGVFRALNGKTGALLWSVKTGGEIVSSAAVGDVDGDGAMEIVFGSSDGKLYALAADGRVKWAADLGSPVLGSPALAQRRPGAALDVYVTAAAGTLFILSGTDGRTLAGFGTGGASVVSSPVVGDVDGDGTLEVFFQDRAAENTSDMSGDLFYAVRDEQSSVPAFAAPWPVFRCNAAHTGFCQSTPTPAPTPAPEPTPTPLPTPAPPPADSCIQASATLKLPKDGKKIWGNAVTLMAEASCGEPDILKIVFQHRHESTQEWTDISLADSKKPYSVYWNVSNGNVLWGTHFLRAVAYGLDGKPDPAPPQISVVVGDSNPDIVEDGNPDVDPNNPHRLTAKVDSSTTTEIALADGTQIQIPAGAVPAGEKIEVTTPKPGAAPGSQSPFALLQPIGTYLSLTFTNGTQTFAKPIKVFMSAPDADGDGIVDGTAVAAKDLKPYYYKETLASWVPVEAKGKAPFGVSALAAPQTAAGVGFFTDHFTLFGLFQEGFPDAPSKGEMYVYPNPVRPGQSPTFIVKAGAARRFELRVYGAAGGIVHSLDIDAPAPIVDGEYVYRYVWNTSGIANGVYFYTLKADTDAGEIRSKGRVALIR